MSFFTIGTSLLVTELSPGRGGTNTEGPGEIKLEYLYSRMHLIVMVQAHERAVVLLC